MRLVLCAHRQTTCMVKYSRSKNRSFKISSRATSNTILFKSIIQYNQSILKKPQKVLVLPLFYPDSLSSRQHFPELQNWCYLQVLEVILHTYRQALLI